MIKIYYLVTALSRLMLKIISSQETVLYILDTLQCAIYTAYCTPLYKVYFRLYSEKFTLYIVHFTYMYGNVLSDMENVPSKRSAALVSF